MLGPMARVLLVDDDPAILRLLEVNFRLEGFETSTASRGEEALATAAEQRPDAIVLDLMLPGLDGTEVYRRLRDDASLSTVPVVFLSARPFEDDLASLRVTNATFVTKPFDPAALIETVQDLIARTPA
jgi:DNA-binding response OmpR family regulator